MVNSSTLPIPTERPLPNPPPQHRSTSSPLLLLSSARMSLACSFILKNQARPASRFSATFWRSKDAVKLQVHACRLEGRPPTPRAPKDQSSHPLLHFRFRVPSCCVHWANMDRLCTNDWRHEDG